MLLRSPTLERHSTPPERLAAISAVPEDSRDTGLGVLPCPPQLRVAPAFSSRKWRGSLSGSCPVRGAHGRRGPPSSAGAELLVWVTRPLSPSDSRARQQDAQPCFQVSPPVSLSSSQPVHPDPRSADSPAPSPYPTCHAEQARRRSRSTQHLAFSSPGRSWGGGWGVHLCASLMKVESSSLGPESRLRMSE